MAMKVYKLSYLLEHLEDLERNHIILCEQYPPNLDTNCILTDGYGIQLETGEPLDNFPNYIEWLYVALIRHILENETYNTLSEQLDRLNYYYKYDA